MLKEPMVLLLQCTLEKVAATKVRGTRREDLGQMHQGATGKETFWGTGRGTVHIRVGTAQGLQPGSTPEGLWPWSKGKKNSRRKPLGAGPAHAPMEWTGRGWGQSTANPRQGDARKRSRDVCLEPGKQEEKSYFLIYDTPHQIPEEDGDN